MPSSAELTLARKKANLLAMVEIGFKEPGSELVEVKCPRENSELPDVEFSVAF